MRNSLFTRPKQSQSVYTFAGLGLTYSTTSGIGRDSQIQECKPVSAFTMKADRFSTRISKNRAVVPPTKIPGLVGISELFTFASLNVVSSRGGPSQGPTHQCELSSSRPYYQFSLTLLRATPRITCVGISGSLEPRGTERMVHTARWPTLEDGLLGRMTSRTDSNTRFLSNEDRFYW